MTVTYHLDTIQPTDSIHPVTASQLPSTLGAHTQSNSLSVTLASDQTVPVSGIFWQSIQPISGTVAISNFPATQTVAGTVAISNLPATQPISGTIAVSNLPATQPVSGSLSVSNFPATQPVSAASLPLPTGAALDASLQSLLGKQTSSTATISLSGTITTSSVQIIAANANRKGLYLYNNSANTVYIALGSTANSANNMTLPIATFATWTMITPIYTGAIYGIRNSGTGNVIATELT